MFNLLAQRWSLAIFLLGLRQQRLACRAKCCAVHLHPGLACGSLGGFELTGYVVACAEVHLVRRLTKERGVGKTRIVLVHIKSDQVLNRIDRVERFQVQPLVFERPPPRFDQRIGELLEKIGENSRIKL